MTLFSRTVYAIPAETVRIAQAAFPHGNKYLILSEELGELYADADFADLFSWKGEVAYPPGRLALVCVMQFMENLSDRQAAEAVRARIDWKYLLGLAVDDAGFDASLLSSFRRRLLDEGAEARLLNRLLHLCQAKGLLRPRGAVRTDATHVLMAARALNRLELVGETMRLALNLLAVAVPDWLLEQVAPDWFDRYGSRMEQARFPQRQSERDALRLRLGADGYHLLSALYAEEKLALLREHPVVETLRQVWLQQYYLEADQVHWRPAGNLPPGARFIQSPSDVEARYAQKRQTEWKGYKVHLTETCEPDLPHLILHAETTPASTSDKAMLAPIHQALAEKALLPTAHLVDGGYLSVEQLVDSRQTHQIELVGPLPPDTSWQTRTEDGLGLSLFAIDWAAQQVICPTGHTSRTWSASVDTTGVESITVRFAAADCRVCPLRPQCTRAANGPRSLNIHPQPYHEALQQARLQQETPEFKASYKRRAGIEGTLSQGTRTSDLRRSRYIGQTKTHLQHILTAVAINLSRLADWFIHLTSDVPLQRRRASTRISTFVALNPT